MLGLGFELRLSRSRAPDYLRKPNGQAVAEGPAGAAKDQDDLKRHLREEFPKIRGLAVDPK